MSNQVQNMMIVGVGGQGTLLASRILGQLLLAEGFDVKVSEVHGMSQRGGSVVTYVRWGDAVASPVVEAGMADWILSFELLEAARWAGHLKPGGRMITNTQQIDPMPVVLGSAAYPVGILEKLAEAGIDVLSVDALTLALEAGGKKSVNLVLLGVLAAKLGMPREKWEAAIHGAVKPTFLEVNLKAFDLGYRAF